MLYYYCMENNEKKFFDNNSDNESNRDLLTGPSTEKQEDDTPWTISQVAAVMLIAIILANFPIFFAGYAAKPQGILLISLLLQDAALFLLPLFTVHRKYNLPPSVLGFKPDKVIRFIMIGFLAGLTMYVLQSFAAILVTVTLPEEWLVQQHLLTMLAGDIPIFEVIFIVIFVVVFAPISEETIYRAFLYPPLKKRFGRKRGIFICGLVFGIIHFNIAVFLPLFVGGLAFAWLYDRYGNIGYNIIAHMVWNSISLLIFFLTR